MPLELLGCIDDIRLQVHMHILNNALVQEVSDRFYCNNNKNFPLASKQLVSEFLQDATLNKARQ